MQGCYLQYICCRQVFPRQASFLQKTDCDEMEEDAATCSKKVLVKKRIKTMSSAPSFRGKKDLSRRTS